MLVEKFLNWYKANHASKRELEKWPAVSRELEHAFTAASGNPFVMKAVDIFWDKYRRGEKI